jgi:phosphotransferase system  glucose/maltose/N-acetylglucosamine-specific IIC component
MTASSDDRSPSRGYVATIIGGLMGAAAGMIIGVPIANANADGGLEAVATALLIIFASLAVCTSIGVGLALRSRRHRRALATALIALPTMLVAVYVSALVATRAFDSSVFLFPSIIVGTVVALIAARALATINSRKGGTPKLTGG